MFRTVFSSTIRSLRPYVQHQVHVIQVLWLLASWTEMEHVVLSQNKINLRYRGSGWFYY